MRFHKVRKGKLAAVKERGESLCGIRWSAEIGSRSRISILSPQAVRDSDCGNPLRTCLLSLFRGNQWFDVSLPTCPMQSRWRRGNRQLLSEPALNLLSYT